MVRMDDAGYDFNFLNDTIGVWTARSFLKRHLAGASGMPIPHRQRDPRMDLASTSLKPCVAILNRGSNSFFGIAERGVS